MSRLCRDSTWRLWIRFPCLLPSLGLGRDFLPQLAIKASMATSQQLWYPTSRDKRARYGHPGVFGQERIWSGLRFERRQGKSSPSQIVLQLFRIFKESGMKADGFGADYVFLQVVDEQGAVGRDVELLYRVQ